MSAVSSWSKSMMSFPWTMRRVLAASAFQYSWSIWEATCVGPLHGHRSATGKFGSKARWLRFWVALWVWCTVLGTCRTIAALCWTRTRHPASSRMKSSARHGMGTIDDEEDKVYSDCDVGLVWDWIALANFVHTVHICPILCILFCTLWILGSVSLRTSGQALANISSKFSFQNGDQSLEKKVRSQACSVSLTIFCLNNLGIDESLSAFFF